MNKQISKLNKHIYQLYEQNRCYGNQQRHELIDKNVYIMESGNMKDLILFINETGNKKKSYVIYKYTNNTLCLRNLGQFKNVKKNSYGICNMEFDNGDTTYTWARLFYDEINNKWKETNFRYEEEVYSRPHNLGILPTKPDEYFEYSHKKYIHP